MRAGDWKLIYFHADRHCQLYNVVEDIGETRDLAAVEPARVRGLSALLSGRLTETRALMSVEKATGRPVPLPG